MNPHASENAKSHPEEVKEFPHGDLTRLLLDWNKGDAAARDQLVTLVYDKLRQMAHSRLLNERVGHTMRTGTLVNEVYLRLFEANGVTCQDRKEFFRIAACSMRQVLVDAARKRNCQKRRPNQIQVPLECTAAGVPARTPDLVKLDEALSDLAQYDPELSLVVELRFFAGYTIEETAEILNVSKDVVKRRWRRARIYLYDALTCAEGDSNGSAPMERD